MDPNNRSDYAKNNTTDKDDGNHAKFGNRQGFERQLEQFLKFPTKENPLFSYYLVTPSHAKINIELNHIPHDAIEREKFTELLEDYAFGFYVHASYPVFIQKHFRNALMENKIDKQFIKDNIVKNLCEIKLRYEEIKKSNPDPTHYPHSVESLYQDVDFIFEQLDGYIPEFTKETSIITEEDQESYDELLNEPNDEELFKPTNVLPIKPHSDWTCLEIINDKPYDNHNKGMNNNVYIRFRNDELVVMYHDYHVLRIDERGVIKSESY